MLLQQVSGLGHRPARPVRSTAPIAAHAPRASPCAQLITLAASGALGAVLKLLVRCIGFGPGGPLERSLTARWMSIMADANGGGVPAVSQFARVQSFAMGGAGA